MEQTNVKAKRGKVQSHFIFAFIYAVIILFEMQLMSTISISGIDWAFSFSVLIIINLVVQSLFLYKTTGLISFVYVFVVFYYLFHFGQVIMLGFFPSYEYDYMNYVSNYMIGNPRYLKETLVLCVNCINLFVLGVILNNHQKTYTVSKKENQYDYKKNCKYVFWFLFGFRVLIDAIEVFMSFYIGYEGTFESFLPGFISALGVMGYSVIPLYYYSLGNNNKRKKFLIFIFLYLGVTMLSGSRAYQTICIISILIVYLMENKLTPRKFLVLFVFALLGLFFLDFIFDMRAEGFNAFLKSKSNVYEGQSKNIILETIGTFGETIFTPFLVFENYRSISPYWGECFVKSLAAIVPDVFGTFKDINNEAVFAKMVSSNHTIGGSFAGEMFYNFGYTYYLPTILIGFIFSKISGRVSFFIKNHRLDQIYLSLPICVLFLWWIRDGIGNMTREIVWLWLLFAVLKPFFKIKRVYD